MYVNPAVQFGTMYGNQANMVAPVAQNNLPFPANAFVTAPQVPNIANPIFNQSLSNDPGIAQYSQMISWALANEIVNRAAQANANNAMRIFGYNLYSHNQFNNTEFLELGRLIAERVRIGIIRNEYQSVEQAIQVFVPDTYTLASGANLRRFDGLGGYITNQVANDCIGAAQALDRIYNEIAGLANLSNNAQMAGHGVAVNNMNQPVNNSFTNFNTVPVNQTPQPTNVLMGKNPNELTAMERQLMSLNANNKPAQQPQQQQAPATKSPLSASYMSNPIVHNTNVPAVAHYGANAPAQPPIEQTEFDRQVEEAKNHIVDAVIIEPPKAVFSRDEISTCPEDVNNINVVVEESNGVSNFHFVIDGARYDISNLSTFGDNVKWAPSALQPFHPLVCLNYQRLSYVFLKDGTTLAVVQDLPEGDYHMDYDKHAVGANFSKKAPVVPYTGKPAERPTYTDVRPAGMVVTRTTGAVYTSVDQAINESLMSNIVELTSSSDKNAIVAESTVIIPITLRDNALCGKMYDTLKNIIASRNFANAAENINAITDTNIRETINGFMTDRVNTIVRFELSLEDDPITNFAADHRDLMDVIKTHYAGAIAETITAYQGRIINSAFDVIKSADVVDVGQYFSDGNEVSKDAIDGITNRTLFVTRNVNVTMINLYSEQLSIYLNKASCAVLENRNPQLREIIEQAVQRSEDVNNSKTPKLAKSILMSLDGFKWEVSKSMTQNSAFLIRKL